MSKRSPRSSKSPPCAPEKAGTHCPVVGIGASAGGLEACSELLRHLPEKTGLTFAVVLHLAPDYPSHLSAILARVTKLTVVEAVDGVKVEKDHVYIIPPNVEMRIADEQLHLTPRATSRVQHLPIDAFFHSLSRECDGTSIGIVLSGNGNDGTAGIQAIKEEGGITFAQDEGTARYPGMPRSAAASGAVDFVLPPAKIAEELLRLGTHPFVGRPTPSETGKPEEGLRKIFVLLRNSSGVDFTHYKQTTIRRRIERRMVVHHFERMEDYAAYLGLHSEEVDALYQDALIHVTSFFREPDTFKALEKAVFPALLKNRSANESIRVWLPGCSTGEEAYSIAISLLEFLDQEGAAPTIQIFGTDVSERVIEKARKGIFGPGIESEVSPERLRRFFTRVPQGWQINKSVRDFCVFARQNVIKDPPFSKLDLVSCRNVLIYFDPTLQKRLMPLFHYALKAQGFLLLGSAESVGSYGELFECVDAKSKIFSKRAVPSPQVFETRAEVPELASRSIRRPPPGDEVWSRLDVQREADRVLMGRFCPPAIVVDENLEIVQFRGRVAPYLEPASGEASLSLFRMTRPGLEIELRAIVNRVLKTGSPVRKENVRVGGPTYSKVVHLEVLPLTSQALRERCFIVLFEEVVEAPPVLPEPAQKATRSRDQRADRLEQELSSSREHLQAMIEEHEATNEELRSANEEIQSSNEELQSTNEELETAKEELQSTNEELVTVNEEIKHRNLELTDVNDDLNNLLRSVNIPIVMLGRDLRIRRFTPVAQRLLKILPGDVGRPITDLRMDLDAADLETILLDVIHTLSTRETEVRDKAGRWYLLQVRPYETADNKITGVVMVLFDIDATKRAADLSELSAAYAEAFLDTVRSSLLVLDGDLCVRRATETFYKKFRVTPHQTEGRKLYELGSRQWDIPELRNLLEDILPNQSVVKNFAIEREFPRIGHRRVLINARRLERDIEGQPLILLSIEDLPPAEEPSPSEHAP